MFLALRSQRVQHDCYGLVHCYESLMKYVELSITYKVELDKARIKHICLHSFHQFKTKSVT